MYPPALSVVRDVQFIINTCWWKNEARVCHVRHLKIQYFQNSLVFSV